MVIVVTNYIVTLRNIKITIYSKIEVITANIFSPGMGWSLSI